MELQEREVIGQTLISSNFQFAKNPQQGVDSQMSRRSTPAPQRRNRLTKSLSVGDSLGRECLDDDGGDDDDDGDYLLETLLVVEDLPEDFVEGHVENLADGTLIDEDTNSILTDKAKHYHSLWHRHNPWVCCASGNVFYQSFHHRLANKGREDKGRRD